MASARAWELYGVDGVKKNPKKGQTKENRG